MVGRRGRAVLRQQPLDRVHVNPPARAADAGAAAPAGVAQDAGSAAAGARPARRRAQRRPTPGLFGVSSCWISRPARKFPCLTRAAFSFRRLGWLAIKMTGAPNDITSRTDLLLRRLSTGTTQNIGNVNQCDFDGAGKLLAYDHATSRLGNGVCVLNLGTGRCALDNARRRTTTASRGPTDSTRLAVLRSEARRQGRKGKRLHGRT